MLIKKSIILFLIIFFTAFPVSSLAEVDISAEAAVVMDAETLGVLFSKNPDKRLSMASTTKIMTSILAIESGKLNQPVSVSRDIITEGTSVGISEGDCMTLETLVHAMMLESGNDAALLTAEYLADNEKDFAELMNYKADLIGMSDTSFVTASGLDSKLHYSTAYDMALLASYAIKNPIFKNICKKQTYNAEYIKPELIRVYTNHNKLLSLYDGVIGIKTGFTRKSGRCLISACNKNGRTLVISTLNAPDDWNDHIKLYDYCLNEGYTNTVKFEFPENISVYGGLKKSVAVNVQGGNNANSEFIAEYRILMPQFIYAPVKRGEIIGRVMLYSKNGITTEYPILAGEDVLSASGKDKVSSDFCGKIRFIINKFLKGR